MSFQIAEPRTSAPAGRGALGLLALAFPWLFGAAILGLIALDWGRAGTTVHVDARAMARTAGLPGVGGALAKDPVCGMEVRAVSAEKAVYGGATYHFCSSYCRDAFAAAPREFAAAAGRTREGHSMRGIPTRHYQWALAAILLLSFGLFELLPAGGAALSARLDLTAWGPLRRGLASPLFPLLPRLALAGLFLLVLAAGLFGDQNPALNLAPLLTWTVWWTGLIFAVLYLGKIWCTVCPWDALAGWAAKLSPGLDLPWPKPLRNIWFAVALFLALTWVELGMGITLLPRATAWVGLGMLGLALASALLFERKSFCRYGCLVGRVSGLYALFSPVEARAGAPEACAACRSFDCWRGNARGAGCPTFEFPRALSANTYCILCAECFKSCPSGSMRLRLRPWGADLSGIGRPRTDEATLALVLLAMTSFHGLTMTPSWPLLLERARVAGGLSFTTAFTGLMVLCLAAPAALYAALAWLSARASGADFKAVALNFAYALLPIALFYHLAHNAEHFLLEGPRVAALCSDPFGWGWDLFGTARLEIPPLVTLEGLWRIQVLLVLTGHLYSLWATAKAARRLAPSGSVTGMQLPMLAAMVAFSWGSLWLLKQPMEMRVSAM